MRKIFILLFISVSLSSLAQEAIITDRPTQSASAIVVPKGVFQLEYGFVSEKTTSDLTNLTYGNFLFRYGLINNVELRVVQNYQGVKIGDQTESGLSPLTLGTKIHLLDEHGTLPQMSFLGQVTLNNGDDQFKPGNTTPEFRLNFQHTLSDKFGLGYNFGMGLPKENPYFLYTLVLGYAFADGWTAFVEPYGFIPDGKDDHRINGGFIYLFNDKLQFDVTAGLGMSEVSPDSFIGFGASILF